MISTSWPGSIGTYNPYRPAPGIVGGSDASSASGAGQQSAVAQPPDAPPSPAASSPAKQRLTSSVLGELLQHQETGEAQETATSAKRHPELTPVYGIGYNLTARDKELLTAAIGVRFNEEGWTVDANGKPAPSSANPFIMHINSDRKAGVLSGDISAEYLRGVYKTFEVQGDKLNPEWLRKGLEYLGAS